MPYADPDYDPVKAHEYYEKHKKLKGRKKGSSTTTSTKGRWSTKGMKQAQREQWEYSRAQLFEQKTAKTEELRGWRSGALSGITESSKAEKAAIDERKKAITESLTEQGKEELARLDRQKKMQTAAVVNSTTAKIDALSGQMKRLPDSMKDSIRKKIVALRATLAQKKGEISARVTAAKKASREDISGAKAEERKVASEEKQSITAAGKEQKASVRESYRAQSEQNKEDYIKAMDDAYRRVKGG